MANVPTIRIDPASAVPAVRQIVDGLRVFLVDGQFPPGASLPSVRRMAIELGVHFNTVAEAYRQLAGEGWLDLQHGKGAVVQERAAAVEEARGPVEDYRSRLRELVARMRSDGISVARIAAELREMAEAIGRS